MQAFQKPEVGQAVMDISQNPANLVKYQDNPEIMKVCPHLLLRAKLLRCCAVVASCIATSIAIRQSYKLHPGRGH